MAASRLPKPGSQLGPCRHACTHRDCAASRTMAATICRFCRKPVGYETRFYNASGLCHAACLEEATESQPSSCGI
jgi:hypothetical protein